MFSENRGEQSMNVDEIRSIALETLQRRGWRLDAGLDEQSIDAVLYELSIHQVELELQNEELRRAQIELEMSRRRYFELYNLAPIGYLTLDQKGMILDANLHAADLLGKPVGQLKGRLLASCLSGEALTAFMRHLNDLFRSALPQHARLAIPSAKDGMHYHEIRSLPWEDEYGQIVGARTVMQDVTKRVKAEMEAAAYRERMGVFVQELRHKNEALQATAEMLRARNQDLAQMAFATSHDLKAPLRTVSSYVKHFVSRYSDELDEDGQQLVDHIMRGIKQMDLVIEALVSYGRLGTEVNPFSNFPAAKALTDAIRSLSSDIEANKALVTHDPLPEIYGDWQQIRLLFQNLLDNSIKYRSQTTPVIHISVGEAEDRRMHQFTVRDNGVGFDPRYSERAFRMFKRLTSRADGTGIGLAQCRRIVENHGGSIWVTTGHNLGSTFYFTLPKPVAP